MFVTRRTHTEAQHRLSDALDMVEKQAAQLRDQIGTIAMQRDALTQHQAHIVATEAQLSACWIRNARGRFERHPMNKAPGQ